MLVPLDSTLFFDSNDSTLFFDSNDSTLGIRRAKIRRCCCKPISDYHSKDKFDKVGLLQTMKDDKIQVAKVLIHLCEIRSCVSDVRRLGKWKAGKIDQRPSPLLLSLTKSWAVRKILSGAHTMNENNKANNCKIHVGKSLTR